MGLRCVIALNPEDQTLNPYLLFFGLRPAICAQAVQKAKPDIDSEVAELIRQRPSQTRAGISRRDIETKGLGVSACDRGKDFPRINH